MVALAIASLAAVTLAMHHPQAAGLEAQVSTSVGAGSSQSGSSGTVTVSTTQNLVQGSVSPSSTTTSVAASVKGPDTSSKTTRTTNWKVWGIVAGLVLVALAMALLTWRYWRKTRPAGSPALERGAEFTVSGANVDDEGKGDAGDEDAKVPAGEEAHPAGRGVRTAKRDQAGERDESTSEGDAEDGAVAEPRRRPDTSTRAARAKAAAARLAAAARGGRESSDDTTPQRITRVPPESMGAPDSTDERAEGSDRADDAADTDERGEVAPLRLFRGRKRESRYANVEISLPPHRLDSHEP